MALAKKCDRCGKLYEFYPKGTKVEYNAVRRTQANAEGVPVTHDCVIDLCKECMSEFTKFMMNGGKFYAT